MVSQPTSHHHHSHVAEEIAGLRMTRQRREIYRILQEKRDHPTANEIFLRAKDQLPNISLATVYSCLDALVKHGIIRQVNFERESSRYCPNLTKHGHFHDTTSDTIHDVQFKSGINLSDILDLPLGTVINDVEITLRGQIAIHQTNQ